MPQDYAEAAKWWRKAAGQGCPDAQYNLGVVYRASRGVPQDYVQAHMWFNLSAAHGDEVLAKDAAKARDNLAKLMTYGQITEAQRLARAWKPNM